MPRPDPSSAEGPSNEYVATSPSAEFLRTIDQLIAAIEDGPPGRELDGLRPLATTLTELARTLGYSYSPLEFDHEERGGWHIDGYKTINPWAGQLTVALLSKYRLTGSPGARVREFRDWQVSQLRRDDRDRVLRNLRAWRRAISIAPWGKLRAESDQEQLGGDASDREATPKAKMPEELKPFESGELVFYPDHVELCGVRVCGPAKSRLLRTILDTLRERQSNGKYSGFSGSELAKRGSSTRGQNAVAESVRAFRVNVCKALAAECHIKCGHDDVIENDRRYGYRFTAKITTRDVDV